MLSKDFLSYLDCRVLSTVLREDDEDAWLRTRTNGIGGSDIGTICGVNHFSSPRLLYLEKVGMYENEDRKAQLERMYFGHSCRTNSSQIIFLVHFREKDAISPIHVNMAGLKYYT